MGATDLDPITKGKDFEEVGPTKTIAGLPITTLGELESHLKILIYGVPGVGKTRLAGSAYAVEEMHPVLYVDIEGGTETLRPLYPDIQTVRVKTISDKAGRVKTSAWTQLGNLYESLKKGDGEYRTVVIDNLTEAYQLAMFDIMSDVIIEHPDRDRDVPAQREWGKASSQVRRWVRHMRDLDMHVIFTAHEAQQTNDSGAILRYTPSLPGKLANEISAYMDFVLYLYTKDRREDKDIIIERKLQTQPAGKYIAKDRSDKLPLIITNPTMADIFREVNK